MDEEKERAIQKQFRIDFIISLIVGFVLFAMGIFVIIVCKYFPDFGEKIGLPLKFEAITGFPLFDIFGYMMQLQLAFIIYIIYGAFPAISGFIILLRSVLVKLLKSNDDDNINRYQVSAKMSIVNLCIVIVNIVFTIGFFELGIYPKIYVIVNFVLAAAMTVITIKRSKFIIESLKLKKKNEKEYFMKISALFKSIVDSDIAPIVICETDHKIVYMNPAAVERYAKKGGASLIGQSLLDCHNDKSNEKIISIVEWFGMDSDNNRVFTFHNPKENKDVYMIALRDENGRLIGYYEKHEYRTPEADLS